MFELMNTIHNDIDGTYCYGMLQYVGMEYGSRGQICVYRCPQCGMEIRNLEDSFSPGDNRPHGGMRSAGCHRDRDFGSGFGSAFGTGLNSGFTPGFNSGFNFGFGGGPEPDCEEDRRPGHDVGFGFDNGNGGFW